MNEVQSFLGNARFYRRLIKDCSKTARPMCFLLVMETRFLFDEICLQALAMLKQKLMKDPILIAPNWELPFELMCYASDIVVGEVLG